MNPRETLPLLLRRRGALADLLPVLAFAVSTAVTATVLGGLGAFASRMPPADVPGTALTAEQSLAGFLVVCAVFATALLVPGAVALGGAAARLSLARREQDLAVMRLIGGTRRQIGGLAVLEVVVQALVGALLGLLLHAAVTPLMSTLDFGIRAFTVSDLLMPWWGYPLLVIGMTVMAAGSAALALAGVVLSPLGVARASRTTRLSVLRLVVWAVTVIGFLILTQALGALMSMEGGEALAIGVMILLIAAMVAGVNLVGPFLLWLLARAVARLAPTPALMVGARRLAADPKAGWRAVAGITFAMIIAGMLTVLATIQEPTSPEDLMMITALRTGGLLTLAIAAVVAAVGTGVPQTARVIDQAPVLRAQHVAGATVPQLHRARLAEIAIPVLLSSVLAAGVSLLVVASMFATALADPGAVLQYAVSVVIAYGLVIGAVLISAPLVRRGALGAARV